MGRYLAAHWLEAESDALVRCVDELPVDTPHFGHAATWGDRSVPAPVPESLLAAMDTHRYRYVRAGILDIPALTEAIRLFQPSHIVHLAEAPRDDSPARLFRTNVEATSALIEAVTGSGVPMPLVVFGSSGGVYGEPGESMLPLNESHACAPVDLYSVSKLASEHVSSILCERYEIPAVHARIFNVVGPGQDERHFCPWVVAQAVAISEGEKTPIMEVSRLTTSRDFIDVRDVARALHTLADKGRAGETYNVAVGLETPMRELLSLILRTADIEDKVSIRRLPGRAYDIKRHYASVKKLRATGFSAGFSLEESIRSLVDYYREEVRMAASRTEDEGRSAAAGLHVSLSKRHAYDVTIEPGLFEDLTERLRSLFPDSRIVVLTDERVGELYAKDLVRRMRGAGLDCGLAEFEGGEASKSLEMYERLIRTLHELEFDRRAVLVNVGGGLVTDVGGFVAATYMRGVSYVNVPTTFLAQHDAATGGKVALNSPWAKNFIGAFHHPRAVLVDPCLLATLEDRDIDAGAVEAIKVAITGDRALFEILEREVDNIRNNRDPGVLHTVVRRAVARKIALLEPDPYEVDLRRALNLGHTFGHPLETEYAYSGIKHGESVAFGIAVATMLARARRICSIQSAERILRLLSRYNMPPRVPGHYLAAARKHIGEVRLIRAGKLRYVLPTDICSVEIVDEVTDAELDASIGAVVDWQRSAAKESDVAEPTRKAMEK